ncbi:type II toxin-antitoxin system HicA family toxin [Polynucleobacter sp. MWH-P3-07-1]|uniref:type II toxin-antitoxin system HicA family toxin n=1 Tax=Polynucleobacter sp. MWH-P3-07-1 TaxID=1743173 RepID=UPI001BFE61DA|nr:type II toxin-antitoxin system HicA family toxin [Polynucleobacter sp. MWH-P3-07-1]
MATVYTQSMGASNTQQIIELLKAAGCQFVRPGHRGNHDLWYSPITTIYIPVDSKVRTFKAANILLMLAGLPEHFKEPEEEAE